MLGYGHQSIDDEDIAAVVAVLKEDYITQGPKVGEFEQAVANYCGAKYGVAMSSGTAALHAACIAAGIKAGDEVITTPLTFAATANAVIYCGGKPVFVDIEDTLNINANEIEAKITPKTKAIIPMDFGGHPAELGRIMEIAQFYGLVVIEDACHALGAEYKSSKIGSVSDMTVFSFHPVKHITTGEGGMVVTNNEDYYNKLKQLRHHGMVRVSDWDYDINCLGYNYRITDFQCALGISQLKKQDSNLARRREIADRYNQVFKGQVTRSYVNHAYHIYVTEVENRDEVIKRLREHGIGATIHYKPVHLHSYYQALLGYQHFPSAENYYKRAVTLPLFPSMTDGDVDRVIEETLNALND